MKVRLSTFISIFCIQSTDKDVMKMFDNDKRREYIDLL